MSGHVDCRKYFEKLSELVDGELDQESAARIKAHLEACPECRVCWATFRKSVEIFRLLDAEPAPEDLAAGVKDFLNHNTDL
jgi:anti-sigma factor (TIGR02949 family)